MNPHRIFVIASNAFREVIRDRALYLLGVFAVILLLANRALPDIAVVTSDKMLLDVGLGAMALIGLVVTVFVGTGLINREIEKRTVIVLLSKPVSRPELIVGKHLGLVAVTAVLVTTMTLFYMGLLWVQRIPFPVGAIALSSGFLVLELSLLTAVAILFGVSTSSLLATLLTLAVYLVGHLSQDLVRMVQLTRSEDLQRLSKGLYLVLPDLSRLTLRNEAIYNALPPVGELVAHASYGLLYTLMVLIAAILIFMGREF
ncbi:ABC transporter permease [Prochlorothrix hollandica]|uniref:Multi-copper enzyme maturation ABC transporter permease n=1 Tax=Prochlorothrix hollandica PCC 9006 = CALU 1027 TaxID=317619 RepID=A0A0M2PQT4_PROHO|nr:ABC transporter permease [Prochlorothrix hollandica]KKI98890.1 multi-copper enzyme maturation ABC transporter permease [Prochlorothrix hollandica PCC 9006 = CALU 1027]